MNCGSGKKNKFLIYNFEYFLNKEKPGKDYDKRALLPREECFWSHTGQQVILL